MTLMCSKFGSSVNEPTVVKYYYFFIVVVA